MLALSTSIQHVKAGKLRALGLASLKRSPIFPDLPTIAEAADMPGFEASIFNGIMAPAATPREILVRLLGLPIPLYGEWLGE